MTKRFEIPHDVATPSERVRRLPGVSLHRGSESTGKSPTMPDCKTRPPSRTLSRTSEAWFSLERIVMVRA
jgi:hypothetical protein